MSVPVYVVGEDGLCCALAKAMLVQTGSLGTAAYEQNASGFGEFVKKIPKMNDAAAVMPVLMLADGDQDACVVRQVKSWMPPHPSEKFMLRLAVREAESWILADREGLSTFADVNVAVIPGQPDLLPNPKETLLAVIRRSRRRILKDEMLPGRRSTASVGLGYVLHLTEFLAEHWSLERAAACSPSLSRSANRVIAVLS